MFGVEKNMTTLFTIGFTKKKAKIFFNILRQAKVQKVIDIRLNNNSQLAGFTKKNDLAFFLKEICDCSYEHRPEWAPTKDILNNYKKGNISWAEYEKQFNFILNQRHIETTTTLEMLDHACLLCSESTSEKCHRRLVAEHLQAYFKHLDIKHL